jgi:hypothetical protein
VTTNTLGGGIVLSIAAQGENIVAAGYKPTAISPTGMNAGVMTRYTPAGVVDPTFGTAGEFYGPSVGGATPTASYFGGVAVAADGSIVSVGTIAKKDAAGVVTRGVLLARLTADGQADATFGPTPDGSGTVARFDVNPNLSISFGSRLAVALDADGNIILGTRLGTFSNGGVRGVVLRFTGG